MLATIYERKLTAGRNNLRVTLPVEWTRSRDMEPSDPVDILISNQGLLIMPKRTLMQSEVDEMLSTLKVLLELKMRRDGKF